jgi:hypothetical protein
LGEVRIMSDQSPRRGLGAVLFLVLALMGMWLLSEKRHSEAWRAELKEQKIQTEKLQVEADRLRSEVAQQRALADERAEEIKRLHSAQAVGPVPIELPLLPQGIVPVVANGLRNWGPEQATGAPNTPGAGDQVTAWAPRTQDGQKEWLELDYEASVTVATIQVYETYNPGALYRVTSVADDGKETEIWAGQDPTPVGAPMGTSEIAAAGNPKTNRIRIYLDSPRVPGWNEIDAVGLVDDGGKTHWAVKARASSSYADTMGPDALPERPVEIVPREF